MQFTKVETRQDGTLLYAEFKDLYHKLCSIQISSGAEFFGIWLGRTEVSSDVTLMHLTQDMAAALIPLLQGFVATGDLPVPKISAESPLLFDELAVLKTSDLVLRQLRKILCINKITEAEWHRRYAVYGKLHGYSEPFLKGENELALAATRAETMNHAVARQILTVMGLNDNQEEPD